MKRFHHFLDSKRCSACAIAAEGEKGSALLEFAISLPLLVVFVVGIYDFSSAFNEKQKIEHAAQEGAIMAAAQPMSDAEVGSTAGPASLQSVQMAIINSLIGSGVVTSNCAPVAGKQGPTGMAWVYKIPGCPGPLTINIDRGAVSASASPVALNTTVTVTYPHPWLGFNKVIQVLTPGANYGNLTLTESATVHNQM